MGLNMAKTEASSSFDDITVKDSFFGNRIFKIKSNTIVVIGNIFI